MKIVFLITGFNEPDKSLFMSQIFVEDIIKGYHGQVPDPGIRNHWEGEEEVQETDLKREKKPIIAAPVVAGGSQRFF